MDITQYDFDFFFQKGIVKIHVATAGGILKEKPIDIGKQDIIRQRTLSRDINSEIELTPYFDNILEYKQRLINQRKIKYQFEREIYARSFKRFAEKYFFSFDRTVVGDSNNNEYHLIAYPKKYDFFIAMLPNELIFIKNHLKFILDDQKYSKFIKGLFEHDKFYDYNFSFFIYCEEIVCCFLKFMKKDVLYTLCKDCLEIYNSVK